MLPLIPGSLPDTPVGLLGRHKPYEGLTLAMGKQAGDYRRVGPECWEQLMRLYGGGPAIYVDGPPVEDLSR